MTRTSRLPGFYEKKIKERRRILSDTAGLSAAHMALLDGTGLSIDLADHMVENAIGVFGMPLGLAVNFVINDREVLIPMAVEEPSVIAAVSFAAKLAREGGGFRTSSSEPIMIGQIQVLDVPDLDRATEATLAARADLLEKADRLNPSIVEHGGGARDIEVRRVDSPLGTMLIVHLLYDTRDAMGANAINTACEALAPDIERLTGGRVNLRILSNLSDRRTARAEVTIPAMAFDADGLSGAEVIQGIVEAQAFAYVDPYRAATHNKGILNGIDAVAIATGNDWRAIEAGAHAYAACDGQYRALTEWRVTDSGNLFGALEMPLAVGIVGGATHSHPVAQVCLEILGVKTARELAEIMVAVGLAQNLAAIRALATEGIQRGHMALHARQIALAAGASSEIVDRIAAQLVAEKNIRLARAEALVREIALTVEYARQASIAHPQN
jgi:hydroxymethylglutaryl-CoA reductase